MRDLGGAFARHRRGLNFGSMFLRDFLDPRAVKLDLTVHAFSASAKEKIAAAGGTTTEL